MMLKVNGIEQRCYKSSGDFMVNSKSIGSLISKLLPKEMELHKDYLADIKIEITLHGIDETGLNVATDYEREEIPEEIKEDDSF